MKKRKKEKQKIKKEGKQKKKKNWKKKKESSLTNMGRPKCARVPGGTRHGAKSAANGRQIEIPSMQPIQCRPVGLAYLSSVDKPRLSYT
jgi:hypothetical protein